jgi:hypothetical protein
MVIGSNEQADVSANNDRRLQQGTDVLASPIGPYDTLANATNHVHPATTGKKSLGNSLADSGGYEG